MTARCTCCGSTALFAVRPGQDEARRGAVDLFTRSDPAVERPVPDVVWCRACWLRQFHAVAA